MIIEYFISAVVLGIVVAIPPGSVTIVACQRALQFGFQNSVFFSLGSCLADAMYISLVFFGVANIFTENSIFKIILWFVCGIVLLILAFSTLVSIKNKKQDNKIIRLQANKFTTFISGILITLTNPVTIVGWIAVAGPFFLFWTNKVPALKDTGYISIVFIVFGVLLWFLPLTFLVHKLKKLISEKIEKILMAASSVLLIIFGGIAWYYAITLIIEIAFLS